MSNIIDKIIENGKIAQYEELETEHGVFTSNVEQQLTAQEVYEKWLYDRENPPTPQLSIEDKISILLENQKAILAGDMQTLAYNLYPEDFNK